MPDPYALLKDHVTLTCECVDRLYLNAYVPNIQCSGQVAGFLRHRGAQIPSPALFHPMTTDFISDIERFAKAKGIPVVRFGKGDCKEEVARPYFRALLRDGMEHGVAMIGVAQEKTGSWRGSKQQASNGGVWFKFSRTKVCVNQYYFYVLDREWGPGFIKVSSYFPFGIRIWLNGHEWTKRQLQKEGIAYQELDNGFRSIEDAARAQEVCDRLGPADVEAFLARWLDTLPCPYTLEDRKFYPYRLSILQIEFSLTQVFDKPRRGREFFEEVVRENLDLGRPDRVALAFNRRITRRTPGRFRTRIITDGVAPTLYVDYKNSKIKQYYKHGRALRTELTVNDTYDFGIRRSISSFETLRELGRKINRRLLEAQCVNSSAGHRLDASAFTDVILPQTVDGHKTPSLRFGEPRVMALLTSLCGFFHILAGFRNRELWSRVRELLGDETYTQRQMTYDLKRLRLNGLVHRQEGRHTYEVTALGRRMAVVSTKTFARVLRATPYGEPGSPQDASRPLAHAWSTMDRAITEHLRKARLAA